MSLACMEFCWHPERVVYAILIDILLVCVMQ